MINFFIEAPYLVSRRGGVQRPYSPLAVCTTVLNRSSTPTKIRDNCVYNCPLLVLQLQWETNDDRKLFSFFLTTELSVQLPSPIVSNIEDEAGDCWGPIHSTWLGGIKLTHGIGLTFRPVRLHRLAGQYDNPMPLSTSSPVRDYEFGYCTVGVSVLIMCYFPANNSVFVGCVIWGTWLHRNS
jgi:hypothetical protein